MLLKSNKCDIFNNLLHFLLTMTTTKSKGSSDMICMDLSLDKSSLTVPVNITPGPNFHLTGHT